MSKILEDGVKEGIKYWDKALEHWGSLIRMIGSIAHKIHILAEQTENLSVGLNDIISHLLYPISFFSGSLIEMENYKKEIIMWENKMSHVPYTRQYNSSQTLVCKNEYFIVHIILSLVLKLVLDRTKESTMGAYIPPQTRPNKPYQTSVVL